MKVAQAVVEVLKEQEAEVIFGIPGGQTLFFTDALLGSGIRFLQTRHEGVAGGAADAWGRLTGKPGLCLATTGPGATNLLTPVGGALRDSSPVIVFLFQNTLAGAGRGDAQEADHQLLFHSLVKKYIPVRHPDAAVWAVREAYRVALTGRPGPVVVDFYRDVIEKGECEYAPVSAEEYCCRSAAVPAQDVLEKISVTLSDYEKVCIWAGNGVKMSRCGESVMDLARKLKAPVVTTFNGISGVDGRDELVYGARTRHGTALTRAILEEADCVLALGTSMSSVATNRWGLKLKTVIQIDQDPTALGRQYPVKCGVCGELSRTLPQLLPLVSPGNKEAAREAWLSDLSQRRQAWQDNVYSGPVNDDAATPAAPVALMGKLKGLLKPDTIVCVDAGNPGAWSHLLPLGPDNHYMKPVNYGNMGFCIPACLACSVALPEREVLGLIGDGSLGMTLGDLETLARFGGKVILVVLNDHAYGNIKQEELFKFGKGHDHQGVDLAANVRYAETARSLGMGAETITAAAELPQAFQRARAFDKPYMIEVDFDGSFSIWPEAFLWNDK